MSWHKASQKWTAKIKIAGKSTFIGSYDDETEAARAFDATVRAQSLDRPLNFPDDLSTAPGVYVPKKEKRVTSSRFRGVCWYKTNQKWVAKIRIDGKQKSIGSYDDETEAARAYDAAVRAQSLGQPLNFPDDLSTAPDVYVPKKKRVASSRFRGVSWNTMRQKWEAKISIAGKSKHIGSYVDETEAARAYDATVRAQSLDYPLNFPDDLSTAPTGHGVYVPKKKRVASSRFRGVSWDKSSQKWNATVSIAGKQKTVGRYDDETEAARAVDATIRAQSLDKPLNFPDDLSTAPDVYVPKKKKKRVGSSRFRGVSLNKRNQKWKVSIKIAGKKKFIGSYDDETEAARAYDATVRAQSLDQPLNFPDDLSTAPGVYVPKQKRVATSRFRGVCWHKTNQKWEAKISIAGKSKHIGSYVDETEAARAYDAIVRAQSLDYPLNFPDDLSTAPTGHGVYVPKQKRVATSRFRGVCWHKTNQKWEAKISIAGKSKHIGSYVDETEAARAYDAIVRAQSLDYPLNFPDDLSTAPTGHGVYVPKKKRVASSRFRGVSWDKSSQKWNATVVISLGSRRPWAATTTRRKQRERTTPRFERRTSTGRSTFRTILLLHLASTYRRRSESSRRGFVVCVGLRCIRSGWCRSKSLGSRNTSAYMTTRRKQRERSTPLFERRALKSRSTFRTISRLHLASTCRRRRGSESPRRNFVE